MTFKEFVDRLHELGVKDEDEINYIDVSPFSTSEVHVKRDEYGAVDVVDYNPS